MANPNENPSAIGGNATLPMTSETTDIAKELKTTVVSETAGDPGHGVPATEPKAFGFDASMLVALAMIVVLALALWRRVPAMIGASLDKRIAGIRFQLDEATRLRGEAEALRAEYEVKAARADADADAMRDQARAEADAIVAKAEADATALIARRQAMAEDKIAAAERGAIAEVRAKAASAASGAAASLIAQYHDAATDHALVDRTIARLN